MSTKSLWVALLFLQAFALAATSQDVSPEDFPPNESVLTESQQSSVDQSIDKALKWLITQQENDGSFPTLPSGQPGITSLSTLAILSTGKVPGDGEMGESLNAAIDYVLDCQRNDGLFSQEVPAGGGLRKFKHNSSGHAALYNHAISGVLLGEVYGMCNGPRQKRIRAAVERGLAYCFEKQKLDKIDESESGGWRYHGRWNESDMSVTSWQIMFMRSARNAGFEVPEENVRQALKCVKTFFDDKEGIFLYRAVSHERFRSRGVVGSGILAFSLAGEHHSQETKRAGKWLMNESFAEYNEGTGPFHYGAFYASQAMYQLGGEFWSNFYPRITTTLVKNQQADGGWAIEQNLNGVAFGRCYSTSLALLALTTPDQLLPLYQR